MAAPLGWIVVRHHGGWATREQHEPGGDRRVGYDPHRTGSCSRCTLYWTSPLIGRGAQGAGVRCRCGGSVDAVLRVRRPAESWAFAVGPLGAHSPRSIASPAPGP
jgi:hypothetical protein